MIPCQKGKRGVMKAYVWMRRTIHLMTSGKMENVRNIFVLDMSMKKTFLNPEIATLASS